MHKGLAISTVLLLLAATWLPLAFAQDGTDYEFTPEMGDLLSTFGRGYVENLVLWSGAGVGLAWGPSHGGSGSNLTDRVGELESLAGGSVPPGTTPIVVPFKAADPTFSDSAPLNHSEHWLWNPSTGEVRVTLDSVGSTIEAETKLAMRLMDGGTLDAEGLLLLDAAVEAAWFVDQRMGYDGNTLGPLDMSDANMTDTNASNGWWLPVSEAGGHINSSNGDWEAVVTVDGPSLASSLGFLDGILALADHLNMNDDLVGAGKAFPAGTDVELMNLSGAVFNNILALYYDEGRDLFHEDSTLPTGTLADLYGTLVSVSSMADWDMGYVGGWAMHQSQMYAVLLTQLVRDDGTLCSGYDTALGGFPGAYVPPYAPMTDEASADEYALAAAALYDAQARFDAGSFASAARACMMALDSRYWNADLGLVVEDASSADPTIATGDQVDAGRALAYAAHAGMVDLAKYRIPQLWEGMVGAGLQLSETDATGENYSIPEPDTNLNGIWKHDWDRGAEKMYGIAPVLAVSSAFDGEGNWTVDDTIDAHVLMEAAILFMAMDAEWFGEVGAPEVSEETAHMLLHWTEEEWLAWGEAWRAEVENVSKELEDLRNQTSNTSKEIEALMQQIAWLEENITALQSDLNDSLENESLLKDRNEWLKERLEEANGTIEDLEKEIGVLEGTVERLTEDIDDKDENITKLQDQLRAEQNNVTVLRWEMENASAALDQAELELAAANKRLKDREKDYDDLQGRMFLVAVIALVAGMIVVLALLKVTGRL